ncbi:MAG: corrinoid protein [Candidatus Zixiibacteriota bacterium]
MTILKQIAEHLEKGNADDVAELTRKAIEQKTDLQTILNDGLIAGMTVVGRKFKQHEIFLPDVLMAARAMYAGMDILKPLMIEEGIPSLGKVVLGTVKGDLHDIGKNLVAIMLRGAGFDVIDLGKDVPPEKFLDEAEKSGASIIGMSALLTTTMPVMQHVIELARQRGLYGKVHFLVGGAPLSAEYAGKIGADAYCFDGISAVERAKNIMGVT